MELTDLAFDEQAAEVFCGWRKDLPRTGLKTSNRVIAFFLPAPTQQLPWQSGVSDTQERGSFSQHLHLYRAEELRVHERL